MIFENDIFSRSSDIPLLKKNTQKSISHWNWPNIYLECGQTLVETKEKVAPVFGVSIAHRQKKSLC